MAKSATRDRQREERWRTIMREQARSGMSIRGFCRKSNLPETAFYFWRRKLQRRPQGNRQAPRAVPAFVSVRIEEPNAVSSPGGRIEIVLSDGRRLHVTAPVDRQALADVLAVLEGLPFVALAQEGQPC
jgi:transposase-like protein